MVARLHVPMFVMCFLTFFLFENVRSQSSLISFDKIFDQFNGVAVWGSVSPSTWHHRDFDARGVLGIPHVPFRYGFELLLGPYPEKKGNPIADSLKRLLSLREVTAYIKSFSMTSTDSLFSSLKKIDSLSDRFVKRKMRTRGSKCLGIENPWPEGLDTLASLMYTIKLLESQNRNKQEGKWSVEGGLGVEFSDSYRGQEPLDNRIPIRAYYLSGYLDAPYKFIGGSWFLGLTGGFYAISNGTTYESDSSKHFALSGSTLGFEFVTGLAWKLGSSQVFMEASYQYLAFDGIQYMNGTALAQWFMASRWPSRIDLSGFHITLGIQAARKE
jgi:hypothetical protein